MNKLIERARQTPNKGKIHLFLGNPFSDGCDKTAVEPGNSYSPGVWTCGISTWVEVGGEFYTPDLLQDHEIRWGFGEDTGHPPVITAGWSAGGRVHVKNRLTHLGTEGNEGVDFSETTLSASEKVSAVFYVVVKDVGPAGGKIESIVWDRQKKELLLNGTLRLCVEQVPSECSIEDADGAFDSPAAALGFPVSLSKGEAMKICFKTIHGFDNRNSNFACGLHTYSGLSVEEGFEKSAEAWREALPAKVFAPDGRIQKLWEREAFHILSAMECGLPRIGAVNYPVFWMRDGIIILRALDLLGRHDLARIGNDYLSTMLFGGGFGAESDAPGEGLWTLVSHGKITKDRAWLEEIFPFIKKRVEWIEKMLTAAKPVRTLSENRIPGYMNNPAVNLLCLPSVNGTIHGRMDWHSPDFFINCWTEGGLKFAAEAASLLGKTALAEKWSEMARKLSLAVEKHLLPVYGNERDPIIAPYPSTALSHAADSLKAKFEEWYRQNRLTDDGKRIPEPLWTYFEAAQIHNALLLGFKEMAWVSLDGMLEAEGAWDASIFTEGVPSGNENLPFRNDGGKRGWLNGDTALGGNMPHNWTSAELINLLRTIFVVEEGDTLLLGKGVPEAWLKPGCRFGVKDMPTDLGTVSYTVNIGTDGEITLDYEGPEKYKLEIGE